MLQQTRVAAVIPYFHRFMTAFPTVETLADADTEHLMKLWEGLGYYSRARNLHAAAKQVSHEFGGRFPDTAAGLRKLSGVGPYAANAIASIAFGEPVPALDGNQARVISRRFPTSVKHSVYLYEAFGQLVVDRVREP
jgi:A/G-specific adenine glycosylase